MFLDAGLKRKVVRATRADQSIWCLTYLEVVVRVYWTLVQYGGEGGEERGSGVEGEILVTRHSSLDTHLYFGGSCVPTMIVMTVVPSGFWLYRIIAILLPFV